MEISVKEKLLRRDIWQVYEDYQDRSENGEWFVVAPAGSFLKQVRESNLEGGRQLVEYRPRDPMEDVKLTYAPLQERYLVGDLANLADEPITPQVVIGWAEENGLLGCSWEEDIVEVEGTTGERTKYHRWGRRESVKRFEEAAREVRACLRMYEAASREGPVNLDELSMSLGPLPLTFKEVLQPWKRHKTVERPWLYDVIGTMVQMRLRDHCFPKLITFTRGGNPSGRFGLGYGFNSLLGAIWLLMAQLLDSQNVTYCRLPDCGRIIDFMPGEQLPSDAPKGARKGYKTRKDKKFCDSDKRPCRQNYWYRKTAGWPGYP
jgi:hypothetical protein